MFSFLEDGMVFVLVVLFWVKSVVEKLLIGLGDFGYLFYIVFDLIGG